MNKTKFTIITPMYNSYNLMERYFDSLENQTFKDFEIIIIDDCSSDDSYTKVRNYAKESKMKITILQSKINSGPGNARNIGLKEAKGDWVTFIDNDDWVSVNMMEIINNIIEKNKVNCVVYDYYIRNDKTTIIEKSMYKGNEGIMSVPDCIANVRNHTVGKFYKLSILLQNEIFYPNLKRCEDVAFVCRAIDACKCVYYLNQPLYFYYQRPNSLSNNIQLDEKDMIKAFNILENTIGSKYPIELAEKSVPDLLYGVLLIMCKTNKKSKVIVEYINSYENKYPNWTTYESRKTLNFFKRIFLLMAKYRLISFMKILSYIHTKLI